MLIEPPLPQPGRFEKGLDVIGIDEVLAMKMRTSCIKRTKLF